MATKLSGANSKNEQLSDSEAEESSDGDDLEGDPEEVPPEVPAAQKDPMIRRKIEDRLERIRLREELGIYDDDQWNDL